MPITIIADAAEELSEPLRKLAKQGADGKFVVSGLPDGFGIEDVKGLKGTLQKLRDENASERAAAKAFLDAGLTIEEAKAAAEALGKMKAGTLKSTADLDAWKAGVETKYADESKKAKDRETALLAQIHKRVIDGDATAAIVKAGGGDALRVLLPLVRAQAAVVEKNGEHKAVIRDESGRVLMSKKSDNHDDMTIEEFVGTLREAADLKSLFKIQAAGGSGSASQPAGRGVTGQQTEDLSGLSAAELIARGNRKTA